MNEANRDTTRQSSEGSKLVKSLADWQQLCKIYIAPPTAYERRRAAPSVMDLVRNRNISDRFSQRYIGWVW